jgi:DNA-binding NarL/FixJ family response regulator
MLWESVLNVMESGGAPMSPAIARKALLLLSKSAPVQGAAETSQMPGTITDREKQILQMMVNGWDAKRIATQLDVSVLTVRKHIANIYEKLQVNSKAQVISLAHKNKWV